MQQQQQQQYTDAEIDDSISEILAETQWQAECQSLPEFMAGFASAQPVRLVPQGREINLGRADLLHPFLAFSRRRRTKAYAENLVYDDGEKKYVPTGPPLEIPKDYIGWFELVPQSGLTAPAACQMSIAGVVATKCRQFLVRTTVVGHTASENNNDDGSGDLQLGVEARVYPGEILQVGDVVTKKWKMKAVGADSGGLGRKKKSPVAETKLLRCTDTKEHTVYLPLAHPGQFYGLWSADMKHSKTPRTNLAYYIHDMLNFGFPFLAKVIFGWPPTEFPEFSGFLRILGLNRPDSLILRSMKPGSCVILELPIDTDVKIENMSNPDILSGNKAFESILGHSCDRIYPYLIGMKHMDTKYPIVAPPGGGEDSKGSPRDVCRMARPRDMNHFNPLEIFPPLDEPVRKVADSWTLSFKDPDFKVPGGPHEDLRDADSLLVDPEDERHTEVSRQTSIVGKIGETLDDLKLDDKNKASARRRDQFWNKRSEMEQVLLEREAEC